MTNQWQFSILTCLWLGVLSSSVQAQSILPASDGTGTRIHQTGNTVVIDGGTQVKTNLFHSFQRFGLNTGELASFSTNPSIQNILGRVTGGEASLINGLIQVTGGNSNLYLMNPAGILFGQGARLDVPGSFMATTATAIALGNHWFSAIGNNDYATLVGTPTSLAFMTPQPGVIVNAGELTVGQGQSLLLVGGTVVNTGILSAPGGKITIAAIPGETFVRLTPEHSLLSLEIPGTELSPSSYPSIPPTLPFTPLTLPQLLTGSYASHATSITVDNGVVRLTGSGVAIPDSAAVAIAAGQLSTANSQASTSTPQITILGKTIGVIGATLDASGIDGGGIVRIGGDFQGGRGDGEMGEMGRQGNSPTLSTPSPLHASLNASRTVIDSTSTIRADALTQGDGGQVILWADQTTGFYGNISARGGVKAGNGGLVEVSGKQQLIFRGSVDTNAPGGKAGTLLLDPVNIAIADGTFDSAADGTGTFAGNVSGVVGSLLSNPPSAVNDTAPTTIYKSELEGLAGSTNIVLQATNDITIALGTFLNFASGDTGSITFQADADGDGVGNFSMDTTQYINTGGKPLTISAANITVGDILGTDFTDLSSRAQQGAGNVNLTATTGNITTGSIFASSSTNGNTITLNAPKGAITLNGIIQAGYTSKTGDSTVTITAKSFRATAPVNVAPRDGFDPATGPAVSIYAFPANQDGTILGAFRLQFQNQAPLVTGSGNTLITIRLLEDTTFTVSRPLSPTGSGVTGTISLGIGPVPNAIVLIQDNQFNALLDADTNGGTTGGTTGSNTNPNGSTAVTSAVRSAATVLEQQQTGASDSPEACNPSATQEQILQVSLPESEFPEQPRSGDRCSCVYLCNYCPCTWSRRIR
jgi:filamentous hemagglutinin family protein